jgi:L-2,4-diaminobutyric acid acetyltransferase
MNENSDTTSEKAGTGKAGQPATRSVTFRPPTVEDGATLWRLARDVGGLDLNTPYASLMMARDFAETCVLAEVDGKPAGFVTGYRPPARQDALFVWQVGVLADYRGLGLASRMIMSILGRDENRDIHFIEATVTPSNKPSDALFRGLAKKLETTVRVEPCFAPEHFPDGHEGENAYRIGPFDQTESSQEFG